MKCWFSKCAQDIFWADLCLTHEWLVPSGSLLAKMLDDVAFEIAGEQLRRRRTGNIGGQRGRGGHRVRRRVLKGVLKFSNKHQLKDIKVQIEYEEERKKNNSKNYVHKFIVTTKMYFVD